MFIFNCETKHNSVAITRIQTSTNQASNIYTGIIFKSFIVIIFFISKAEKMCRHSLQGALYPFFKPVMRRRQLLDDIMYFD